MFEGEKYLCWLLLSRDPDTSYKIFRHISETDKKTLDSVDCVQNYN